MTRYRNRLPQLQGSLFLTDGGLETTLIYQDGFELPCFAAFDLLKSSQGIETLRRYFHSYVDIAVGRHARARDRAGRAGVRRSSGVLHDQLRSSHALPARAVIAGAAQRAGARLASQCFPPKPRGARRVHESRHRRSCRARRTVRATLQTASRAVCRGRLLWNRSPTRRAHRPRLGEGSGTGVTPNGAVSDVTRTR